MSSCPRSSCLKKISDPRGARARGVLHASAGDFRAATFVTELQDAARRIDDQSGRVGVGRRQPRPITGTPICPRHRRHRPRICGRSCSRIRLVREAVMRRGIVNWRRIKEAFPCRAESRDPRSKPRHRPSCCGASPPVCCCGARAGRWNDGTRSARMAEVIAPGAPAQDAGRGEGPICHSRKSVLHGNAAERAEPIPDMLDTRVCIKTLRGTKHRARPAYRHSTGDAARPVKLDPCCRDDRLGTHQTRSRGNPIPDRRPEPEPSTRQSRNVHFFFDEAKEELRRINAASPNGTKSKAIWSPLSLSAAVSLVQGSGRWSAPGRSPNGCRSDL